MNLTNDDLKSIKKVVSDSIDERVPKIIDERVPKIINEQVPKIINELVPGIVADENGEVTQDIIGHMSTMHRDLKADIGRIESKLDPTIHRLDDLEFEFKKFKAKTA